MIGSLMSTMLNAARNLSPVFLSNQLHTVTRGYVRTGLSSATNNHMAGGSWSLVPVRTNVRWNFPRAGERKRVKVHGWITRMSTPSGRKIIMRRILKGRHVLSH